MKGHFMSSTKLSRVKILEKLSRREIKQKVGARVFGLSVRQVKRLVKRYRIEGVECLVHKTRNGARVTRKHDQARTPYQRLVKSDILSKDQKQSLNQIYEDLNPMILLKQIRELQAKLLATNRYKLAEATNT